MLVNASSFSVDSDLQPMTFTTNFSSYIYCGLIEPSSKIFTTFNIINTLLFLPVCIFILYHGLWQWQQRCSTSSTAMMTHSDCFTYHLVTIELIGAFGSVLSCCGAFSHQHILVIAGGLIFSFNWYGQMFFNILTCVERYLAVAHPITYRNLRNERGIRIRNINVACVWLLCFLGMGLVMDDKSFVIMDFSLLIASLVVTSFCSLSVLYVLIHPGPGEQGGVRDRVDHLKRRAFYTIVAILGVLMLRFACNTFWVISFLYQQDSTCLTMVICVWINLPNSLMLPLLFLRRKGKLLCCKNNIQG